jgi:uroporphyrinogen-III synthase
MRSKEGDMTASGERPAVALFRAREDATATAARLRRLDFSVVCLPVIEIRPSPVDPRRLRYDAVIASSDKAFLSAPRLDTRSALYVVGARTGRAAEGRGWRLASPPAREAGELVTTLIAMLNPGASVLYLAGRDRKEAIEAALAERFELEVAEIYAAEAREAWRPSEARALARCVAALHYSRRSARLAAALAKTAGATVCFLNLKHVCLSRDVAEPLQALGATRIAVAETPDEAGLFHALREEVGGFPSLGSSRI